jgi:hypothetical protein
MFKYIADILSKISAKQRVLALGILLFAITIIIILPKIVNSFTYDNEELTLKVQRQRVELLELSQRVTVLNKQVIDNQMECTNQMVLREREILDVVSMIESEVKKTHKKTIQVKEVEVIQLPEGEMDGVAKMQMMPKEKPKAVVIEKIDNSKVINMVKKLKADLQKDLNK